jgi:hypothetical protein
MSKRVEVKIGKYVRKVIEKDSVTIERISRGVSVRIL